MTAVTDIANQLYVDPLDRAEVERLQKERGVLVGFEFEAYRKDRTRIWLSVNQPMSFRMAGVTSEAGRKMSPSASGQKRP